MQTFAAHLLGAQGTARACQACRHCINQLPAFKTGMMMSKANAHAFAVRVEGHK